MINIFSKLVLLGVCLIWAWMLFLIVIRYPDNHGAGPLIFRWSFMGMLIFAGICMVTKNGIAVASLALALIGFAMTWVLDSRNIMVDYDIWIKRGMPTWGQVTPDSDSPSNDESINRE